VGKWIGPDGNSDAGRISSGGYGGGLSSLVKSSIPVAVSACGDEVCNSRFPVSRFKDSVTSEEADFDWFSGWGVVLGVAVRREGGS
jgi:hypothetical protein